MPAYDLSNVEVAVIDTQSNTLRLLRDVLSRLGVKKIELYDSIPHAAQLLTGGAPDVVLVDCDGPHEAEAFRYIRTFRNEPETPNPYAVIIVTTWQATPGQLMRTTNCGADDLISKPLSPKQLQERLHLLIEARKKFVVTADYTGPDRRKSPREGVQMPLIDVPNTLRLKALGRWPVGNYKQMMDESARQVNLQKRLRGAIQVSFLIEYAVPGLTARPAQKTAIEHVSRVPGIVEDMQRRLSGSPSPSSAETLCRALKAISEKLCSTAEQGRLDSGEVAQAQKLADELMHCVAPERPLEDMRREVASAVAGYRSRLEQLTLAKQGGGQTAPGPDRDGKAPAG
ncbi:MAG TPA: response regulator [Azospirillaceae bacterium]|nr:response regulator [Azospirillaceae bacterium]HRQ80834.1 response regulator [Azospirillaceae bacterium]